MKLSCYFAALAVVLVALRCPAQTVTNGVSNFSPEGEADQWSFSASLYGFVVPDSRDYVNPNFTADRGWIHIEGRYNYEALETGSLWVGYNLSCGENLVVEFAPMIGGVFGELTGVAPGYNFALSYKRLSLSSQGEYVFDVGDSSGSFFYTWSELSYSPLDWLHAGLAVQRTKAYDSDLDIQRGFLVGLTYRSVDLTTYVFNLGWTEPTLVMAVTFNF
jgi:hypothetical protein